LVILSPLERLDPNITYLIGATLLIMSIAVIHVKSYQN